MTTTALLILQESLTNRLVNAYMVEHGSGAMFSLTPIWSNSRPCVLRIIDLFYHKKAKGYVLSIQCVGREFNKDDIAEIHFRLDDPIRFAE